MTLFISAAPMASQAEAISIKRFVGLWEAVDPDDGSHQILSITDNEDGTVNLHLYDTYFTLCNGGRAIGQGTGEVSVNRSLASDDFTVTCFETGETEITPTTFTRNLDGTLTRFRATLSPLMYHRTSK
jgi:hypothetical protein